MVQPNLTISGSCPGSFFTTKSAKKLKQQRQASIRYRMNTENEESLQVQLPFRRATSEVEQGPASPKHLHSLRFTVCGV